MTTYCGELLDHVGEAILMLDDEGYIRYANQMVAKITGYDPSALLGKSFAVFYDKGDDSIKAEYELDMARRRGWFCAEGWRTKMDGSSFWGELRLLKVTDEQNPVKGFSCILRDTSERREQEMELRLSEERYRLMVDAVRDYAIIMLDPTGNILTWNEGATRTKGYSSQEAIGRHFSMFYTAEDLNDKKPEMELKTAVETGKYEEEGWRVRKNGTLFWANVVITALFNERNQHIGFSKVTRDLTERKGTEEVLRQSEERYRSLVEQVTDYGIFMLDEKGRIVSWNEGARRIKGYTAGDIIGKYFSIFYPEEDILSGKPANELRIAKKEGKYEEEGWRLRKDGTRFWANIVITAVYHNNGTLVGFSKVTRDLTERKEAEKALRQSYTRYRELAGELKAANAELSYANEELEQFTSIVSHDLQEPIRTIKSFLQLIEIKLGEKEYGELTAYIGKSINAANRMKELIQNLLHYSQMGKKEIATEEVAVEQLLSQALQNLKSTIENASAEITVETEVPVVAGDRIQLVQLIQNLLSNALKFTDARKPLIKVRCAREDNHVKFAVSDNGIGIAAADLNKVFEIFKRLNTQKEYPGTGIGLAICKKIVDRHGGRIWTESAPGQGTTFYFTIREQNKGQLQTP